MFLMTLALATTPIADHGRPFACRAPYVHDGDYIRCAGRERMRLAAIDAPEFARSARCRPRKRGAVCDDRAAIAARDNLRRLVAAGPVVCRQVDANPAAAGIQWRDRYGRPIVRCTVNGRDLGDAQLRGGFANAWP